MVTLWGVMDANEGLTVYFDCKDFSQLLFLFKTFATLNFFLLVQVQVHLLVHLLVDLHLPCHLKDDEYQET